MRRTICIFCSSSDAVPPAFIEAAEELVTECVKRHYGIVYGGTSVGLMGAVARTALAHGGKIIGVIPQQIADEGLAFDGLTELVVTKTLRQRRAIMEERSEGFLVLPGGLGTLEELLDVIEHKQLKIHRKPIVLYNVDHFFNPLLSFFDSLVDLRLLNQDYKKLLYVASHARHAIHHFDAYRHVEIEDKWIKGK